MIESSQSEPSTAPRFPASAVPPDLVNHPRYEVLALLGQGGMGAVYKARHRKMDRLVALKVIHSQLLNHPKAVERFQREVRTAAQFNHPNIVRADDADQAGGTHFLVMEFVEGTDLARYVSKKGPLPIALACEFARQAALGLQFAHEHGMVHRDIKPHNLMLTRGARRDPSAAGLPVVKVMDFGLALIGPGATYETSLTGVHSLIGTADYIAPEQAQAAATADIRSDIYSLGCSLFHLLAGRAPLAGRDTTEKLAAHLTGKLPFADLPKTVSAALRGVLARMVATDPLDRYQTPGDVATALTPFIRKSNRATNPTGLPAAEPTDPIAVTVPAAPRRRVRDGKRRPSLPIPPLIGGGLLAALIFLAAAAVFWAARGRQLPTTTNAATARRMLIYPRQPPEGTPATFTNALGMEFILVPKGKSWLGGGSGTPGDKEVEIGYDFYLGKYEVTQGEWESVQGNQPSWNVRSRLASNDDTTLEELRRFPVEQVWHDDAQAFVAALNQRVNEPGWIYRLPTEAEWEYACRGGPMSDPQESRFDFYFDAPFALAPNQLTFPGMNYSSIRTRRVGTYRPNPLGLYDMHGNVWEWCDEGAHRGGGWRSTGANCRATARVNAVGVPRSTKGITSPVEIGLRIARVWTVTNGK